MRGLGARTITGIIRKPPHRMAIRACRYLRGARRRPALTSRPRAVKTRAFLGNSARRKIAAMTYIVMDACIKCKFMDCVEVCPVDCFYEGENFLAINPDECIDCGVCEPECPVDAIKPDTEDDPDGKWLRINSDYAKVWPNITVKGEPPADREDFERETGKFEKYFSEKPGTGS
jgi:ferredoxin